MLHLQCKDDPAVADKRLMLSDLSVKACLTHAGAWSLRSDGYCHVAQAVPDSCAVPCRFAQLIGTRGHAEYRFRITKDDQQHSLITKEPILE